MLLPEPESYRLIEVVEQPMEPPRGWKHPGLSYEKQLQAGRGAPPRFSQCERACICEGKNTVTRGDGTLVYCPYLYTQGPAEIKPDIRLVRAAWLLAAVN
jgi:hypothetical protein